MESGVAYVVDDEQSVCDSLWLLLSIAGVRARTYTDGWSFLAEYDHATAGCIVIDGRMPGIDGAGIYSEFRRKQRPLPSCIVTSADAELLASLSNEMEQDTQFVLKPYRPDHLVALIKQGMAETARVKQLSEPRRPRGRGSSSPPDPLRDSAFANKLHDALDNAIAVAGASRGNVQIFNWRRGGLEIYAQRGFARPFLDLFELVRPCHDSACGRAFRLGYRIAIPNVATDSAYAPYVDIARRSGYLAVQSTPIFSGGRAVGMLSTHFGGETVLSAADSEALDRHAAAIGGLIAEVTSRPQPGRRHG
ncbi:MAG: response regulator [Nevskia sp.]|nr:response regulator [Nevskia sp.]